MSGSTPSTEPGTAPVTVSVTRHVDPSRTTEMLAWVQAGTSLAERFEGFLGSGWVRPSEHSPEWHMLYRFADAESLAAWEASPQRAWWLEAAQGQVEETRVERRTGIEGWFDEPATVESSAGSTPPAPPRWKQMVLIFMVFLPLSLTANWVASRTSSESSLIHRAAPATNLIPALRSYISRPGVTQRLESWLPG